MFKLLLLTVGVDCFIFSVSEWLPEAKTLKSRLPVAERVNAGQVADLCSSTNTQLLTTRGSARLTIGESGQRPLSIASWGSQIRIIIIIIIIIIVLSLKLVYIEEVNHHGLSFVLLLGLLLWSSAEAAPVVQPPVVVEGLPASISVSELEPGQVVQLWRGGNHCKDGAAAHVIGSQVVGSGESSVAFHLCALCCGPGEISACLLVDHNNSAATPEMAYVYDEVGAVSAVSVRHAPTVHALDANLALPGGTAWPVGAEFYVGLVDPTTQDFLPGFCLAESCADGSGSGADDLEPIAALLNHSTFVVAATPASDCPTLPATAAHPIAHAPIRVALVNGRWRASASAFGVSSADGWVVGEYSTYVFPPERGTSSQCKETEASCAFAGVTTLTAPVHGNATYAIRTISDLTSSGAVLANITSQVAVQVVHSGGVEAPHLFLLTPGESSCAEDWSTPGTVLAEGRLRADENSDREFLTPPFRLAPTGSRDETVTVCVGANRSDLAAAGNFSLLSVWPASTTLFYGEANRLCAVPPLERLLGAFAFLGEQCWGAARYNVSITPSTLRADGATVLMAPPGTYDLCYATAGGSETSASPPRRRLEVFAPYVAAAPETVYVEVPFLVNVSAGDIAAGETVSAFLLPAEQLCESLTSCTEDPAHDVLDWIHTTAIATAHGAEARLPVTLAGPAHVSVRLCLRSQGATRNISIAEFEDPLVAPTPTPPPSQGMLPTSMVKGREAVIRSLGLTTGYAMVSRTANCTDPLLIPVEGGGTDGVVQGIHQNLSTLFVPRCAVENTVYYCESKSDEVLDPPPLWTALQWTSEGTPMHLLSLYSCELGRPINLVDHIVPAARPISTFGLTDGFAFAPYISCNASCGPGGPTAAMAAVQQHGYPTPMGARPVFYVCVTSPDGTLVFTTDAPTLLVSNFSLAPRSAAANVSEPMALAPPAPVPTRSFWSRSETCSSRQFDAAAIASGAGAVLLTATAAETGLYYLCTEGLGNITEVCEAGASPPAGDVAIDAMLLVAAPVLLGTSPAVTGSMVCATVAVPNRLYSMVPGEDDASPYAGYYQTDKRAMFMEPERPQAQCTASGADGQSPPASASRSADGSYVACFNTSDLVAETTYTVCAETPVGLLPVAGASVRLVTPSVSPVDLVSGSASVLHAPMFPNTNFALVPQPQTSRLALQSVENHKDRYVERTRVAAGPCDAVSESAPHFTTNSAGVGEVRLVAAGDGGSEALLPAGAYMLCRQLENRWLPELSVEVFSPSYFRLFPTAVVTAVVTPLLLQEDLETPHLMPGVFDSSSCAGEPLSTEVADWATEPNSGRRRIVLNISAARRDPVYLCARAPVNGTAVALPKSGFRLLAQPTQYAPTFFPCYEFNIYFSAAVKAPETVRLALRSGPCCPSGAASAGVAATGDRVMQGLHVGPGYRTFLVNDTTAEAAVAAGEPLHVCYADAAVSCVTTGEIAPSPISYCDVNINYLEVSDTSARRNTFLGATNTATVKWLIVGFSCGLGGLLIALLIAIIICWRRTVARRNKIESGVTRRDEQPQPVPARAAEDPQPSSSSPGAAPLTLKELLTLSPEEIRQRLNELLQAEAEAEAMRSHGDLARLLATVEETIGKMSAEAETGGVAVARWRATGEDASSADTGTIMERGDTSSALSEPEHTSSEAEEEQEQQKGVREEVVAPNAAAATEEDNVADVVPEEPCRPEGEGGEEEDADPHAAAALQPASQTSAPLSSRAVPAASQDGLSVSCPSSLAETTLVAAETDVERAETHARHQLFREEGESLRRLVEGAYASWRAEIGAEGEALATALEQAGDAGRADLPRASSGPASEDTAAVEAAAAAAEEGRRAQQRRQLEKEERRARRRLFREEDDALGLLLEAAYGRWRASLGEERDCLQDVLVHDVYWGEQPDQLVGVNEEVFHNVAAGSGEPSLEPVARALGEDAGFASPPSSVHSDHGETLCGGAAAERSITPASSRVVGRSPAGAEFSVSRDASASVERHVYDGSRAEATPHAYGTDVDSLHGRAGPGGDAEFVGSPFVLETEADEAARLLRWVSPRDASHTPARPFGAPVSPLFTPPSARKPPPPAPTPATEVPLYRLVVLTCGDSFARSREDDFFFCFVCLFIVFFCLYIDLSSNTIFWILCAVPALSDGATSVRQSQGSTPSLNSFLSPWRLPVATHTAGDMLDDPAGLMQLQATPQGTAHEELYVSDSKVLQSPARRRDAAAQRTPCGITDGAVPGMASRLLQAIDTLRTERHQREDVFVERIRRLEAERFELQQEGETQRLQLQEQQECTHRLQKENTVLCSQITELREQLAAVGDLCRRRGKALHDAGLKLPVDAAKPSPERAPPAVSGKSVPTSFSLRSIVRNAATVAAPSTAVQPTLLGSMWPPAAVKDDPLNRSSRSDGPSFDYNDLIPVTKEELDPELLAALHPPEASTVSHVLALTEEVHVLRQQMDAQRMAYEQERARRTLEERNQHRAFSEEREDYAQALRRLEEMNECAIRDLVDSQHSMGAKLRAAEEEAMALKQALMEALDVAERAKAERTHTAAHAENAAATKYKHRLEEARRSLQLKTEQWTDERRQLVRFAEECQGRAVELEADLGRARSRIRKEAARAQLAKEGAESELRRMRESMRRLERKLLFMQDKEAGVAPATAADDIPLARYYMA
eukprot:gene4819-3461_t